MRKPSGQSGRPKTRARLAIALSFAVAALGCARTDKETTALHGKRCRCPACMGYRTGGSPLPAFRNGPGGVR